MTNSSKWKQIVAIMLVLLLVGAVAVALSWLYEENAASSSSVIVGESYTARLERTNTDFSEGLQAQNSGDYDSAITEYQQALSKETDPYTSLQTKMYLGVSYQNAGKFTDAIETFKSMFDYLNANTELNWSIMQAYTVQQLAKTHEYDPTNTEITKEIFSSAPYNSFGPSATTTTDQAYRNLYAYAASFYPLGISDTRIAQWYAYDLLTTLKQATNSAKGKQYLGIINTALSNTDNDVQRLQNDPVGSRDLGEIFARKGEVDAILTAMHIDKAQDMNASFQLAKQYEATYALRKGVVEQYQAFALALLYDGSASSTAAIDSALSIFTAANSANINPYVAKEFAAARSNNNEFTDPQVHPLLVKLARIDPSFKEYLGSLGWQDSDFSK